MRKLVAGKLHGIYVTEANLNYHGSITLDPDQCEEAGILPRSSSRSGTRIPAHGFPPTSSWGNAGCCILNGAAARTCQPGDQVIICNSVYLDETRITSLNPKVPTFDEDNRVRDRLSYSVDVDAQGRYTFDILDEANTPLPTPLLASGA